MVKVLDEQDIESKAREYEERLRAEYGLNPEKREHFLKPVERRFVKRDRENTTILWGGLTLAHEELVTEAMRGLGYKVQPIPCPDNEALRIGKEVGNRGQCNPTYYTVGNLVKYLTELRDAGEEDIEDRYVFVTAGACGPCRFGMYEAEYRKALRDAGFHEFRVLLFEQSGGFSQSEGEEEGLELNASFGLAFLKGLMIGDLVNDLGYKIRPYEIIPGETNRVLAESKQLLGVALREGNSLYRALKRVKKKFETIEVDYSKVKPKVKITGEFWAQTTEGDGNYHMFSWLESEGAEVLVEPIGTWIEYLIHIAKQGADEAELKGQGSRKKRLMLKMVGITFRRWFNLYRRALGYRTDELPDQKKLAEYAEAYYDTHLRGGEGHLEIAKNVMATRDKHAHMVISLKPFGCMPSTMSDGVQSKVVADYQDAIFLPVETSGDGEVNVRSRVQMKLYEAKMKARKEMEVLLEDKGITIEQVQEYTARHKKWRNAMRKPKENHKVGMSTATHFVAEIAGKI